MTNRDNFRVSGMVFIQPTHNTVIQKFALQSLDLILEIEKLDPLAVVVDMGLYDRVGGIDPLNLIRDRLDVNAWFE